jgi:hypothetical protein
LVLPINRDKRRSKSHLNRRVAFFMTACVYILYSVKLGEYYVGGT